MADLPFLTFPPINSRKADKRKPTPRGKPLQTPGRGARAQASRLGPQLQSLFDKIGDPEGLAQLRADPSGSAPERALVLEVAGDDPEIAYRALRNVPGFEFLGEDDEEMSPDFGFTLQDKSGAALPKAFARKLYFAMPSVEALRRFLSLWRDYAAGNELPHGVGAWTSVFDHLITAKTGGPGSPPKR